MTAERFRRLRRREFARLDEAGLAYLDYTGSGLYAESQIRDHADRLRREVLGNPHSENGPSRRTTELLERARAAVLAFFDADPDGWMVCFTANASAAAKLVGEAYRFGPDAPFVLTADNHNSVNGIREFAAARGAPVHTLPLDGDLRIEPGPLPEAGRGGGLFAFPAQSNFSGVKHPLAWIEAAHERGHDVLLDAAAFVPTNRLSLSASPADFVCLSFYKMFGFPTGVGALLARRAALERLHRPWFAGGTVAWVTVDTGKKRLLPGAEAFEDGTPNFLDVAAVPSGLELLREVGMEALAAHVAAMIRRSLEGLRRASHPDGSPRVEIYGPPDERDRGSAVAFNLLEPDGRPVPYEEVERRARAAGIAIRGGCFCNPGCSEAAFRIDPEMALGCLERAPADFHPRMLGDCLGEGPVGALRASVGLASVPEDIDRLVEFVSSYGEEASTPPGRAGRARGRSAASRARPRP